MDGSHGISQKPNITASNTIKMPEKFNPGFEFLLYSFALHFFTVDVSYTQNSITKDFSELALVSVDDVMMSFVNGSR